MSNSKYNFWTWLVAIVLAIYLFWQWQHGHGLGSVSYTHLDVYKRQILHRPHNARRHE